jgi:hypothetical protein
MQVLRLKDLSSQDSTGRFLCVLLEYESVGIRKTKQNLYELEFIVDEVLFYDLKHCIELPCIVHAISHVVFPLFLSPVILERCVRGRR